MSLNFRLGEINENILGHKVIKIEEFPTFQIEILERLKSIDETYPIEKIKDNLIVTDAYQVLNLLKTEDSNLMMECARRDSKGAKADMPYLPDGKRDTNRGRARQVHKTHRRDIGPAKARHRKQ